MDHFAYRDGALCAEDVPLAAVAEAVGTPFYCYSTATLRRHYHVFMQAFAGTGEPAGGGDPAAALDCLLCYSIKANSNQAVIATLAREGAGADVVSGGELARALAAGVPPDKIVFSGVGKTAAEIEAGLKAGILQFNAESTNELRLLSHTATTLDKNACVTIRVNPDIDARTHHKISTGRAADKFGIPWKDAQAAYALAAELPGIEIVGVDMHIGSQLTALEPFEAAFDRLAGLVETLRGDGHNISHIDLGGGLGIPYGEGEVPPLPADYGGAVHRALGNLNCRIIIEPGRLIAGNAGVLVASVLYIKESAGKTFVILDAAMNDLIRPAMYDAWHHIEPVKEPADGGAVVTADIVGPVCETADTFARGRAIAQLSEGDLVAVRSAGAYGAVMASTYNTRPLVPEVLVNGGEFAIVRPRLEADEIIALDRLPAWLG